MPPKRFRQNESLLFILQHTSVLPSYRKAAFGSNHQWRSKFLNAPCVYSHQRANFSSGHLRKSTFKIQVQLVISICACISGRNASRCKTVGEKTAWESQHKNLGTQQRPLPISISGIGRLRPYPATRKRVDLRTYSKTNTNTKEN